MNGDGGIVGGSAPQQFAISQHYDVMVQLDQDVHDDKELSRTEVETALRLIGRIPRRVFLPCFGTGRHIPFLKEAGVQEIVGVDLSEACAAKAHCLYGHLPGVHLEVGDLLNWNSHGWEADATILLGNSFGDCIDPAVLAQITAAMVQPLRKEGVMIMDYIGKGYLDRCAERVTSTWDAMLDGEHVKDSRTPEYDLATGVMTIRVVVRPTKRPHQVRWTGAYQKRILANWEVQTLFTAAGVSMTLVGSATRENPSYYGNHGGELGMIARSNWWRGVKR